MLPTTCSATSTAGIVPLSGDEARKFKHVREGEIENNRRFVEQTFVARNTDEKTALALRDLKDGETLEVSDR